MKAAPTPAYPECHMFWIFRVRGYVNLHRKHLRKLQQCEHSN
jgi:hypothetical protein